MALRHLDLVSRYADVSQLGKKCPFQAAVSCLSEDACVVQIGSHTGHSHNDPIHLHVHNRRWHGVAVEPIPYLFDELRKQYHGTSMGCCNAAIAGNEGRVRIFSIARDALRSRMRNIDYGFQAEGVLPRWADQIASLSREHVERHLPGEPIDETEVECITPSTLCQRYMLSNVDLLHIDAEGFDSVVLAAWDFASIKPSIIRFEVKHMDGVCKLGSKFEATAQLLRRHGYALTLIDDEDMMAILTGTLEAAPFESKSSGCAKEA